MKTQKQKSWKPAETDGTEMAGLYFEFEIAEAIFAC
jgi:hypothetical protein